MAKIDVELSADIQEPLSIPRCVDLRLPQAKMPEIRLPTGGSIKAIADLTKGIPSDCALNFSLAAQLAPIMASIECLVKLLALIKPLIEMIKAVASLDPIKIGNAMPDFIKAAAEAVAPCLLVPTPLNMIPFVKDILALLIAMLRCLVQQLRSVVDLLARLETSIAQAERQGNVELLSTLQCAQENARISATGTLHGIEPIKVLLELAGAFMEIAGVPAITLPDMGAGQNTAALRDALNTLQGVLDTMQQIVDALP
jgi:hypothetical protein